MAPDSGEGIDFPADHSRARQKLFRFLDNHFNSERYRENVRQLTPAILAVLPIEYRNRLLPEDNVMARLARLEKETSEAKIAVAMDAPRHQKLKELSEGIVEMYRVDPGLTGPLMEWCRLCWGYMTGSKWRKPRCSNTNGFQVQKQCVIAENSMSNTAEIINFPNKPNNREVVWPTCRTGIPRSLTRSNSLSLA
ncbi:bacteriophage regulatory protein CII [Escherichia coli]|uniref:Bacteriophage regulatory protein CII n=1 Tax=Escherichia coli TaxID=562 RepID=A0A377BIV3_ECOLX|nr:bacteriophage regulatory protein CII [Escherichia coli]